jgi:AcrR family transcriptional regulator
MQARPARARRRPLRGTPDETRTRLVATAARVFNRDGYHGTDSNRIAREAGYSPGAFYKHFRDKRAIFLDAYEAWVTAEWEAIDEAAGEPRSAGGVTAQLLDFLLRYHRRWRGFRASMRALIATDPVVRRHHRRQRSRQLGLLRDLRRRRSLPERSAEEDALLLFTLERTLDALAEGEVDDLGLSSSVMLDLLAATLRTFLRSPSASAAATASAPLSRPRDAVARGSARRRDGSSSEGSAPPRSADRRA